LALRGTPEKSCIKKEDFIMTFKLLTASKLDPITFSMAYNVVLEAGQKAVREGNFSFNFGDSCTMEVSAKVAELAAEMAKLSPAGFIALSQRLLSPELGGHDGIPYLIPTH